MASHVKLVYDAFRYGEILRPGLQLVPFMQTNQNVQIVNGHIGGSGVLRVREAAVGRGEYEVLIQHSTSTQVVIGTSSIGKTCHKQRYHPGVFMRRIYIRPVHNPIFRDRSGCWQQNQLRQREKDRAQRNKTGGKYRIPHFRMFLL